MADYMINHQKVIDSDDDSDVIVGAPYHTNGGKTRCGAIYVYCGGPDIDSTVDYNYYGEYAGDHFGWSVSYAGDMNNDGNSDLIVGAPHYDTQSSDTPPSEPDVKNVYFIHSRI